MFPFEVRAKVILKISLILESEYSLYSCVQNGIPEDDNYDFQKCVGLRVKPRRGDGVLFYSVFPNGTIDEVSYIRNAAAAAAFLSLQVDEYCRVSFSCLRLVCLQTSLHGSCPVVRGKKWVATKWIRDQPQDDD